MGATTAEPDSVAVATTSDTSRLRAIAFIAGCLLVILAASGVLDSAMFTQPSLIKYGVTVIGSVFLVLLLTAAQPLRILVGVAILVAPFDFVTTFDTLQVTPLLAVDLLALFVWLPRSGAGGTTALRPMALLFVLLLVPALAGSDAVAGWALWLAATVATGCLTFVVAREPGGPAFVATMIAASALLQGTLAIWEHVSGHQLNLYQAPGTASYVQYFFSFGRYARPAGALPDPIGLGQVLALCVPLTVALAVGIRRWLLSLAVLGAAGVAALALLLSLSRMSTIGAAFGLVVTLLLLPRKALRKRGAVVVAMVAIVTVTGVGLAGNTLTQRLNSIIHPTASHVSTASGDIARSRMWRAALKTGESHLVTGVGFGRITQYLPRYGTPVTSAQHAHNTYLQFFAEGGVLGLLALIGVLGAAAIDLVRGFAANRLWVAGAAGSLVATMLAWITDVEVRYVQVSAMVAVLLGLIAAIGTKERRSCQGQLGEPHPAGPATETMVSERVTLQPGGERAVPAYQRMQAPPIAFRSSSAPTLAIVVPSREDGGAERYVRVIAQAAAQRGWTVHAGFPPLPATSRLRQDLRGMGVRCHPLAAGIEQPHSTAEALRLAARDARRTVGLLARVRPTSVLVVLPHPDQAPGLVLAGAMYPSRAVASVQLYDPELRVTAVRRLLYSACRRLGERWLVLAPHARHQLAERMHWREDHIDMIYNGVADDFACDGSDRSEIRGRVRAEIGLAPEAKLIITVARLNLQKGYDLIAESIPVVIADHDDAHWVWVGDGPDREWLTGRLERTGSLERVRMLGFRDDVARLLAAADLFIFPSRMEGAHPFAVGEALVCELPVLVSAVPPFPEMVRDGVEGRLVPPGDPVALAAITSWALHHRAEMSAMAAAGRRRVLAEFSRDAMVAQTLELLWPESSALTAPRLCL